MSEQKINSHLVWAVFSLLMFWPTGIPAIINATGSNTALKLGNEAEAEIKSQRARKWCRLSLIIWMGFVNLYIWFMVLSFSK